MPFHPVESSVWVQWGGGRGGGGGGGRGNPGFEKKAGKLSVVSP